MPKFSRSNSRLCRDKARSSIDVLIKKIVRVEPRIYGFHRRGTCNMAKTRIEELRIGSKSMWKNVSALVVAVTLPVSLPRSFFILYEFNTLDVRI